MVTALQALRPRQSEGNADWAHLHTSGYAPGEPCVLAAIIYELGDGSLPRWDPLRPTSWLTAPLSSGAWTFGRDPTLCTLKPPAVSLRRYWLRNGPPGIRNEPNQTTTTGINM